MYEINPDKQDLPEGFSPLLGSDTHGVNLSEGHFLEKRYHLWRFGPLPYHVGELYEQCRDQSNGISILLERDVNRNCTARLSVVAEILFEL